MESTPDSAQNRLASLRHRRMNLEAKQERLLEDVTAGILDREEYIRIKAALGTAETWASLQSELQKQKRRVEKNQMQVMRDYEAYISGNLSKEAFLQRKTAAKADEAEAGIQVLLLSKQLEQLNTEAKSIESMLQAANPLCRHIRIQELTPELLREFVQSITVYPDGIINIIDITHERKPHPAKRPARGRGDPRAGQRPHPRLRHFSGIHAGAGRLAAGAGILIV